MLHMLPLPRHFFLTPPAGEFRRVLTKAITACLALSNDQEQISFGLLCGQGGTRCMLTNLNQMRIDSVLKAYKRPH